MMNVGIIFYAASKPGMRDLFEIAQRHCLTTRRTLVRGDGSTAHEGIFDLETGEFLRQSTQQGWRGDSCWARGLAWALYGFSTFTASRRDGFLETASLCAEYYLRHTITASTPRQTASRPTTSTSPTRPSPTKALPRRSPPVGFLNLALVGPGYNPAPATTRRLSPFWIRCAAREFLARTSGWEGMLKHGSTTSARGWGWMKA